MKKVIVYIEDQVLLSAVRQILLARPRPVVDVAETLNEVVTKIDLTTVVLTDLCDSTAFELLGAIRKANSVRYLPPVIVLTSPGNEHLAVQALWEGAISYVPDHLVATLLLSTLVSVFPVANAHHNPLRIMECVSRWNTESFLDNDRSLFGSLVRYFQESNQRMGLCEHGEDIQLGIAIEKTLVNNKYYGNLGVSSSLCEQEGAKFYAQVEARRLGKPYSDRQIYEQATFSRSQATFVIKNERSGFDVASVPDPTNPANVDRVYGRGLLLMRMFMDEVEYNEVGNQVRFVERRQICDPS